MSTIQIREVPEELHKKLTELAKRERRSLSQQVLVILEQAIESSNVYKHRRKKIIESIENLEVVFSNLSSPTELIRKDRDQ